ncbi:DUF350 domain-containing protein [Jeongeupia naejangsanensis]|uniref:DUF350 domain-containing protein n=1 Tax=Jeongeupia naejangsanensis TaxID=613195 RepID=A0ABS2BR45_9NEIS|nr:DUF350 domain-containing protein [Jeongeupia naejangsanensis]MBM3117456.1 DUF350 domain-containing protein [Jeongeupia naejangsanensis]
MLPLYSYLIYLLSGLALVALFAAIYVRVTPFAEIALIRQGCLAAALSFGGALLGFSLTVAASAVIHASYPMFLLWAAMAALVQLVAYIALSRLLPNMNQALIENNVAMGALMGTVSLVVGILNAACLS